jgi:hypothetical protein
LLQGVLLIASLPIAISLICEATQIGQLALVLAALALLPSPRPGIVLTALLLPVIVVMHPVGLLAAALLTGLWLLRLDAPLWLRALCVLVTASAAVRLALRDLSPYERRELGGDSLRRQFEWSLTGWQGPPYWPIACLGAAALTLALLGAWNSRWAARSRARRWLLGAAALSTALLTARLAMGWASNSSYWLNAVSYRRFGFFSVAALGAPVLLWLRAEARAPHSAVRGAWAVGWLWLLTFCACQVVMASQWGSLRRQLAASLERSHAAWKVGPDELRWLLMTPLRNWTLPYQSLLVQGRKPSKVAVYDEPQLLELRAGRIPTSVGFIVPRRDGWFDYSRLLQNIAAYDLWHAAWREALAAPPDDAGASGRADLIVQPQGGGPAALWLAGRGDALHAMRIEPAPPEDLVLAGAADFDGDLHADLAWSDRRTGAAVLWLMSPDALQRRALVGPIAGPSGAASWRLAASADFDGDGRADLVWQDTRNLEVQVWLLDGGRVKRRLQPDPRPPQGDWRLAAVPDANRDGTPDLLWQSVATGRAVVWLLRPDLTRLWGGSLQPGQPEKGRWQLVTAGRSRGPGDTSLKLLWRRANGRLQVWHMRGPEAGRVELLDPRVANAADWRVAGALMRDVATAAANF